ncbi:MAG TPA: pilus assembly protein TadG-related protein [Stellaceae bacterium]|nr:pilus assembly protein TadG-related protein [Stellaceae bacterium]
MNTTTEKDGRKSRGGFLRRFIDDRSGVVAILTVVLFPILIGIGGLAVDVGAWYIAAEATQGVADAASFAAALAYQAGNTSSTNLTDEALAIAKLDGFTNGVNGVTIVVNNPPATGPNTSDAAAVEVIITQTQKQMLSAMLGSFPITTQTRAVSAANSVFCILALTQQTTTGISMPMILSSIDLHGCSIGDNAKGASAMTITGALLLQFKAFTAVIGGSLKNTCFFCAALTWVQTPTQNYSASAAYPIPDPYAARTMPTASVPTTLNAITPVPAPAIPAQASAPAIPTPTIKNGATCAYTATINASSTLTANQCYRSLTVAGTVSLSVAGGGTATICGGTTIAAGSSLTLTSGTFLFFAPSTGSGNACTGAGTGITVSGGTFTVNAGVVAKIRGSSTNNGLTVSSGGATLVSNNVVWGTNVSGGTLTVNGNAATPPSLNTFAVSGGTANLNTGISAWTTTASGGTLNVNAGSSNLYGLTVSTGGTVTVAAGNSAWTTSVTGGSLSVSSGNSNVYNLAVSNTGAVTLSDGNLVWQSSVTGGTLTLTNTNASTCTFNTKTWTACLYGISVGGGTATLGNGTYAMVGPSGQAAINVSSGTLTMNGTPDSSHVNTVMGPCNSSFFPAIAVSGGTLNMNAGSNNNYSILGGGGQPGISISGGTFTMGAGSNAIQGGPKTTVAAGCSLVGLANGGAGISTTGGTLNMNAGTNNILGQTGAQAIVMTAGTINMGAGTNNIQGASGSPSIQLTGTSAFITADGTTDIIGGQNPLANTPGILLSTNNGLCGLLGLGSRCDQDLELGAGTYTIWEGLTDIGGNVTLNPNATSIGTYIIAGGAYCLGGNQTATNACTSVGNVGDLNLHNGTLVLTRGALGATDYASYDSTGADGDNLVAPVTGNTAGIAIFQDRSAPTTGSNTIKGISFLTAQGAFYFPDQPLAFNGISVINNGGTSGGSCLQLIAYTVTIQGLAFLNDECSGLGLNLATGASGTNNATLLE